MITIEEAASACQVMALSRYFPSSEFQRSQIAAILIDMVGTKDQLDWLVKEQSKIDWKGPYEMRLLFTSRFQPQDKVFDQQDSNQLEADYFAAQAADTAKRIEGWKQDRKLLGTSSVRIDLSPALKAIGETRTQSDLRKKTNAMRQKARDERTRDYLDRC